MEFSVLDISALCGVARSTVSYWIATGRLPAQRTGRKYTVRADDLKAFLNQSGRALPAILENGLAGGLQTQMDALPACWQVAGGGTASGACLECPVYVNRLPICLGHSNIQNPDSGCMTCTYYHRHLYPKVEFIHRVAQPAMVVCDHTILAANAALAGLCAMEVKHFLGLGVEQLLHGATIKKWLAYHQRRMRQDAAVPQRFHATIRRQNQSPVTTIFHVAALLAPLQSWLVMVDVPAVDNVADGGLP